MGSPLEDLLAPLKSQLDRFLSYDSSYPRWLSVGEREALWKRIQTGLDRNEAIREEEDKLGGDVKKLHDLIQRLGPVIVRGEETKETKEKEKRIDEALSELKRRANELKSRIDAINKLFGEYDKLSFDEYSEIKPELTKEFESAAKARKIAPWQYYQWLRKYYYESGFTRAYEMPNFLNAITKVRFLGRDVLVRPEMASILENVERKLQEMGPAVRNEVLQRIRGSILGFQPRPINNSTKISNHAFGLAVDVDATWNPHLVGKTATAIDKLLDWLQPQGLATAARVKKTIIPDSMSQTPEDKAADYYARISEISNSVSAFLTTYLENWESAQAAGGPPEDTDEQTKRAYALLEDLHLAFGAITKNKQGKITIDAGNIKKVKAIRDQGLKTIPLELFAAMKSAGARLGVEYHTSKDIMHFEVPPPPDGKRK